MKRLGILISAALLFPLGAFAATYAGAQTLVFSEPAPDNVYLAGGNVSVTTPIAADLTVLGGTVNVSNDVAGDALIGAGNVNIGKPVKGDARIFAARAIVNDTVGGDLVALAGTFADTGGGAKSVFVIAASVSLLNGAAGPVTVYGSDVSLAGTFAGDVHVSASNRLSLGEGTVIRGALYYDAPQQAEIPASAQIAGGAKYTGHTYLPTTEQAHAFLAAGLGVLLLVRILAAVIAAALIVGLFPSLAQRIVDRALAYPVRRPLLLILLGFAVLIATPVALLFLALTFVGLGLAFVIGAAYALALLLAYGYAAAIAGNVLARRIVKRETVLWRDAATGVLALFLIGIVPVIGWLADLAIFALALGALISVVFVFAFGERDESPPFTDFE